MPDYLLRVTTPMAVPDDVLVEHVASCLRDLTFDPFPKFDVKIESVVR